jgi:flagellar biosynthetic protein FliR
MTLPVVSWIVAQGSVLVLIGARVGGLAWTAPALAAPAAGWRFRLGLTIVLGALLLPTIGPAIAAPPTLPELGLACLVEAGLGAALGGSAALIVAGARQAGDLVGSQAGLSPAALFDPDAGEDLTALGHLYGLVALGTFLALDGPMALVKALIESYQVVPVGAAVVSEQTAQLAFGRVGDALALSLRAAAPAALAVALAGVAIGLLGRAAPSLPLVALALPIRSMLGLVVVGLGLMTLVATLSVAWTAWPGW